MKICQDCFADEILKSEIKVREKEGTCDICFSKDSFIYDTETENYLFKNFFEPFISIFSLTDDIEEFPTEQGVLLKTEVVKNWNIFTTDDESKVYKMLSEISKEAFKQNPKLLTFPVGVKKLYDSQYLQEHSLLLNNDWEAFVKDIKYNNRFHSNYINKKLLKKYCSTIFKTYEEGQIFYRCRISPSEEGFKTAEMGAPPKEKTCETN